MLLNLVFVFVRFFEISSMADEELFEKGDARKHFREGQKFVTPIQGDATRGFYESLLEEKPDSPMAIRFCIEYGVLSGDKLKHYLKQYNKLKDSGSFNANKQAIDRLLAKEESKIKSEKK